LKKIIIATTNQGKLREIKKILGDLPFDLLSLSDFDNVPEVVEDRDTFIGNAEKKATEIYDKFQVPVIADDSGLAVDQLNGSPGVYSARYAGEDSSDELNNKKLISELKGLPSPHPARFISVAVYFDGNDYISASGELVGEIVLSPRGQNGFGYDPLFVPEGYSSTLAELSFEEKNNISHRAKAFNKLKEKLNRG
jgi:XTP/dITP diphosphohydrolase